MKKFFQFFTILLLASSFALAQTNVPPGQPDALFNAAAAASAGDVLVLADGGIYPNSAPIPVQVGLTIKTADGAASKARLVPISDAEGQYPGALITADASLTLINIIASGQRGADEATGGNFINRGTITNGKIHFDGVEAYKFGHVCQGGDTDTLIVENSFIANNIRQAGGWGTTFGWQHDVVSYIRIQNNTFIFNVFGPFLQNGWGNYSPPEEQIAEIIIDHNTIYNVTGAHGPTTMFSRAVDVKITNNLYINPTFRPNEHFSDKYIDFPHNEDEIGDNINVISVLGPKGMWLFDVEMIDSAGTVIDMHSNNISFTTEILDAWSSRGLEKPYIWTNEMERAIINTDIAYFEEEVQFTDAPATPMFAVNAIADFSALGNADPVAYEGETPFQGWDWYTGIEPTYDYRERADLDMSFNADAQSYTAADDGFPVGDLNWFPTLKTLWESGGAVGVEQTAGLPTQYQLSQNYPNPFNPTTKINFSIPEAGEVSIKVFNVLGQEVAQLVNQSMQPGTYNVDFDASGLNSGVYVYQITSGSFTSSKKMLLLK